MHTMEDESYDGLSDEAKLRVVSGYIMYAPPGEFNEVFNDIRILLNNDNLLQIASNTAVAKYNKDQLTPVKIEGSDHKCLITNCNELGGNRFFDPRSKQSFKFNHLMKEASDFQPWDANTALEPWRSSLEEELTTYVGMHYKNGICSVVAQSNAEGIITLTACIEGHQFRPDQFWVGRLRSTWTSTFSPNASYGEIQGSLKVHVHYYEDGNIQLVNSKDVESQTFSVTNHAEVAKEIVSLIKQAENEYQEAVEENFAAMSGAAFKSLRRQLPVTRAKIDWSNIVLYGIGKELKPIK